MKTEKYKCKNSNCNKIFSRNTKKCKGKMLPNNIRKKGSITCSSKCSKELHGYVPIKEKIGIKGWLFIISSIFIIIFASYNATADIIDMVRQDRIVDEEIVKVPFTISISEFTLINESASLESIYLTDSGLMALSYTFKNKTYEHPITPFGIWIRKAEIGNLTYEQAYKEYIQASLDDELHKLIERDNVESWYVEEYNVSEEDYNPWFERQKIDSQKIKALENNIQMLKDELCLKDNTYSWCRGIIRK